MPLNLETHTYVSLMIKKEERDRLHADAKSEGFRSLSAFVYWLWQRYHRSSPTHGGKEPAGSGASKEPANRPRRVRGGITK
jgi:hypothetical protein